MLPTKEEERRRKYVSVLPSPWRCPSVLSEIHGGESSLLFWLWHTTYNSPLSTEFNDKQFIISHKKSRGRWLHANFRNHFCLFALPVSAYRSRPVAGLPLGDKRTAVAPGLHILTTPRSGERELLFRLWTPRSPSANSLYVSFARLTSHVHA